MNNAEHKANGNERAYPRVNVGLRAALCMPGQPIALARTFNISEGGVSITTQAKDNVELPKSGARVKLQLDGVVSNGSDKSFDIYAMKVVYATPSSIGLAFEH